MPFSASKNSHAHIAIVGAGPRGTSALERVCSSASDYLAEGQKLTIHMVDPSPPGAGLVWRQDQSPHLLMNTVTSQITMFTDDSVICDGPVVHGPSLYEWGLEHGLGLGPDDYASRAQYGAYLEWVFGEAVRRAPTGVDVEVHAALATSLDNTPDGLQTLGLSTGLTITGLASVILAQGHLPLQPDAKLDDISAYAEANGLRHFQPSNPADVDLSTVAAGEPILLRGIGLNFFDYMSLFTNGRGGKFTRTEAGALKYEPSGNEPHMYAASRRGIPYHSRGDNAKGAYGRHMPLLLKEDVIAEYRKRAEAGNAPDFRTEIWPQVAKEVEWVYYEAMLRAKGDNFDSFTERFLATAHGSEDEAKVLEEFGVPKENRWSWDHIERPQGDRSFESAGEWRDWLLAYLREDVTQAKLNNVDGPLKSALDCMRDLRNELRLIVDHNGVSGASYRDDLDKWYTPLNAYLSIGPPRVRMEQMIALIEAGVLDVLGPRVEVRAEDGAWVAKSPEVPGSDARVTTIVEARLPTPIFSKSGDKLLNHLLSTGQCRPHAIDGYETGGMDVTQAPYRLIDTQGVAHPRRFAVGVPTEGVHWVTAAGARPGVNSVTLTDCDAVARGALGEAHNDLQAALKKDRAESGAIPRARIALGLFWQRAIPLV